MMSTNSWKIGQTKLKIEVNKSISSFIFVKSSELIWFFVVACKFEGCKKTFSKLSNLKKHVKVEHENTRYACFMCNEILKSVFALKKHLRNPLIHDFNKEFDPGITEVQLQEDKELKHTEEAKNKIITELKQQKDNLITMVKTLQGEKHVLKEQTIPKVQKLENENKALQEKLAKTMDALET